MDDENIKDRAKTEDPMCKAKQLKRQATNETHKGAGMRSYGMDKKK